MKEDTLKAAMARNIGRGLHPQIAYDSPVALNEKYVDMSEDDDHPPAPANTTGVSLITALAVALTALAAYCIWRRRQS